MVVVGWLVGSFTEMDFQVAQTLGSKAFDIDSSTLFLLRRTWRRP